MTHILHKNVHMAASALLADLPVEQFKVGMDISPREYFILVKMRPEASNADRDLATERLRGFIKTPLRYPTTFSVR